MVQVSRPDSKNSTRKSIDLGRQFFHYFWHHVLIIKNRCSGYQIQSEPVQNHICTSFFFNFREYELQGLPEQREYWKTMAIFLKRSVGQKIKTSPAAPANYSLSTYYRGLYALRVTPRYQTQQRKWSLTTPWYAGWAGSAIWEITFLTKMWLDHCFSIFSLFRQSLELIFSEIKEKWCANVILDWFWLHLVARTSILND